ncbi:flagellar biosynthetic protein FliR [Flocculibacter collagenilyticus]|uniref:flagellar biosynthetic protein FliR n=1 Tax=Flocculibacter collagenilyticus TaxID=2744479 RepID=UPI0018F6479D|nr:flagellar biosynthetic protein FliR [Flocculibacter collagenilyticus]
MEALLMIVQPFTLILCRVTPLFLATSMSPLAKFPGMVRLVSLIVLSICLTEITVTNWLILSKERWLFNLGLELGLGMLMLLSFQLTITAIQILGRVLDMQIGFAAAGVVDPASNNNDPLLGYIFSLFVTLAIFLTNTHHEILAVLTETFKLIPPGSWNGEFYVSHIMGFFFSQLLLSLLLLGPVIMGLWLLDIFNGFIAKTMPQMNVYFVMLPLKIGVGIFLLSVAVSQMKPLIAKMFSTIVSWFQLGWIN